MVERTRVIGAPEPPAAWLVIRSGRRSGRDFRLSAESTIGRDASVCDVILEDEAVSAEHAKIKDERGEYVLYDLASTNGTLLNGARIQRAPLSDGDIIVIGSTKLIFKEVRRAQG